MQNWVKQLFSSTDRFLDILNVGRLIFYTAAGYLALAPAVMCAHLVASNDLSSFGSSLSSAIEVASLSWSFFFASVVTGFVIAEVGFDMLVVPVFKEQSIDPFDSERQRYNFNYRYPQLKNDASEDYQGWLLSEYFRYIEIAAYVPFGAFIGLFFIGLYVLLFLALGVFDGQPIAVLQGPIIVLLLIGLLFTALRFVVWPFFWRPQLLVPTVKSYINAKVALLHGVEDFQPWLRENGADAGEQQESNDE